jgi:hypothetical protein
LQHQFQSSIIRPTSVFSGKSLHQASPFFRLRLLRYPFRRIPSQISAYFPWLPSPPPYRCRRHWNCLPLPSQERKWQIRKLWKRQRVLLVRDEGCW